MTPGIQRDYDAAMHVVSSIEGELEHQRAYLDDLRDELRADTEDEDMSDADVAATARRLRKQEDRVRRLENELDEARAALVKIEIMAVGVSR